MGNSLRCCLACVLPCGALDLIRIVHLNGTVEEITRPTTAAEILKANPNHVLSKPSSQGVVRKILIVSPDSDLKRGSIYFLIPYSSLPEKKKRPAPAALSNSTKRRRKVKDVASLMIKCRIPMALYVIALLLIPIRRDIHPAGTIAGTAV